ncbi:unnamed protein product, partial [Schistosoma mattheei]|uniref:Secreted protein n=3 Tax=Schistosoma TaxID=6181 RepID=A0A183KV06_9TREM
SKDSRFSDSQIARSSSNSCLRFSNSVNCVNKCFSDCSARSTRSRSVSINLFVRS